MLHRKFEAEDRMASGIGEDGAALVAGSVRSGTTWLAEMICAATGDRLVFEPFWAERVPQARPFHVRQYIRPQDPAPEHRRAASAILSGACRNPWTDQLARGDGSGRLLVKDVRAQLFLGWLRAWCPEVPLVLVLRHPCAVAASRLRKGWDDPLALLLEQETLRQDWLAPFVPWLCALRDPFDVAVAFWCIENAVPLHQLGPRDVCLCFYEDLCRRPETELERIGAWLRRPLAVDPETIRRPSAMSDACSAVVTGAPLLDSWRSEVGPDRRRRAQEILERLHLGGLYGEGLLPEPRVALRLLEGGAGA